MQGCREWVMHSSACHHDVYLLSNLGNEYQNNSQVSEQTIRHSHLYNTMWFAMYSTGQPCLIY